VKPSVTRSGTTLIVYAVMVLVAAGTYLGVRSLGEGLVAPTLAPGVPSFEQSAHGPQNPLLHILLVLAVVMVLSRLLGAVFRRIHQPPVIGEIIAGIMLGPSLLGQFAPSVSAYLLPPALGSHLAMIAQVGIVLFMFLVGVDLDTSVLRKQARTTAMVSHVSIVVPFSLGLIAALSLYPRLSTSDVPFTTFALFIGVSMSITAFPVLARILSDRGLSRTDLGVMAISCAAIDDVTAWCLLAVVVAIAKSEGARALITVAFTIGYLVAMLLVVAPIAKKWADNRATPAVTAMVIIGVLLSSIATEAIGIHALFGAFLLGALIPHDSRLATELQAKMRDLVSLLFLPAFFALTGMRTEIGLLSEVDHWVMFGAILAIACAGKLGGSTIAARFAGLSWRTSLSLGVLMNTRGLIQLIVLDIGLQMRILTPALFTMMVLMALVTTFATTPLLAYLEPADVKVSVASLDPGTPG